MNLYLKNKKFSCFILTSTGFILDFFRVPRAENASVGLVRDTLYL